MIIKCANSSTPLVKCYCHKQETKMFQKNCCDERRKEGFKIQSWEDIQKLKPTQMQALFTPSSVRNEHISYLFMNEYKVVPS